MANFFQFKMILVLFVLLFSANVRANVGDFTTFPSENSDVCEAPPPDSFRVTSIGSTFVTLAWTPVWQGALHFIELKKLNGDGNWNADRTFDDVSGVDFYIDSLNVGGTYRVIIRTKCPNGEKSGLTNFIEFQTLILELATNGRTPLNPKIISGDNVQYENYEWVGFRVAGGGASGLFEVIINEVGEIPYAYIARVMPDNGIVATNDDEQFPIQNGLNISGVGTPFSIFRLLPDDKQFVGNLDIIPGSSSPITFSLRQILNNPLKPWLHGFKFFMLSGDFIDPTIPTRDFNPKVTTNNRAIFNNPVAENLTISFPIISEENEVRKIQIKNSQGQTVLSQMIKNDDKTISLSVSNLTSGFYFLTVQLGGNLETFKIVKQ